MKFSLVVATLNRVREVERLFQSLMTQDRQDFEVILVDQNLDNRLITLVDSYRQYFPILHLRESKRGLSHARNVGLLHVQGDIISVPDDDCLYPANLLNKVSCFLDENPNWDGIIGRVYDLEEDKNAFESCGDNQSQEVDYIKLFYVAVSCGIFFRTHITDKVEFDEEIGPGASTPWSCGDETDYLFRCLDEGYRFYYDANLIVRHPNPLKKNNFHQQIWREYSYGLGKGYFLATHHLPKLFLRSEYRDPYRRTILEFFKGNFRRAAYALVNGVGTSVGYQAGLKKYPRNRTEVQEA